MIKNLGQVAAIYVGKTAPRNANMMWLDNTVIPYIFRSYNGEEWTEIPTGAWLVSLQQGTVTTDDDYLLINSGGVNYKMTVKDFVKSSVGNPLDFKGVIRTDSDFPNPSTLEGGDMYIIITEPAGGTVTDPYSGKTFSDSEKIVWDSVINSWASLGKIDVKVDLSTTYSATKVTIHSSAGKETTVVGVTDDNAGVMVPVQKKWLDSLSDGSTLTPQGPSTAPYHKHRYSDIVDRIISQQVTGNSEINPMSQKATTEALNLKLNKSSVLQVSGVSTTDVMSQKAVTDAIQTLKSSVDDKLSRYLPLSGGTLTGDLVLSNDNYIRGILSTGTPIQIFGLNSSNTILVGNGSYNLLLYTGASDISHWKRGTSYKIWDASNVSRPLDYVNGTAGSVTGVYTRNLNLNGTNYPFIGTGTTVVTLFAPTTAGTSGQVLQSQGAGKAPIWVDGGTGGGGVSLSDNNTWTGTDTFKRTVQMQSEDLTDAEGIQTCGYNIQITDLARTVNFKLEGHLDRNPVFKVNNYNFTPVAPYATLTVDSGLFTFNESGSLTTKISGTNYEFWNKNNLAKPITYNTNTEGDAVLYKGDSASKIDRLVLPGTMPDDSTPNILQGGTGGFGSAEHAYASCHIGAVYTNEIHTYIDNDMTATVNLTMDDNGVYFAKSDGTLYKLTMEVVS